MHAHECLTTSNASSWLAPPPPNVPKLTAIGTWWMDSGTCAARWMPY
jgi:hypothetical protein